MNLFCWIVAGVAAIGMMALTFRGFFRDADDFRESLRFVFTPDLFSLFRGEYWEDVWGTLKFDVWFALGIAVLVAVRMGLGKLFGVEL